MCIRDRVYTELGTLLLQPEVETVLIQGETAVVEEETAGQS